MQFSVENTFSHASKVKLMPVALAVTVLQKMLVGYIQYILYSHITHFCVHSYHIGNALNKTLPNIHPKISQTISDKTVRAALVFTAIKPPRPLSMLRQGNVTYLPNSTSYSKRAIRDQHWLGGEGGNLFSQRLFYSQALVLIDFFRVPEEVLSLIV